MAEEFPSGTGRTFTPVSREAVDRWIDRQGVALRLMTEDELVGLAMKHSRGKVDPSMVRQALRDRAAIE